MMTLQEIELKCISIASTLEKDPSTAWWKCCLVDCVGSLAVTVDALGKSLEEQKRLKERCDSLEKRYSELLYRLKSGE